MKYLFKLCIIVLAFVYLLLPQTTNAGVNDFVIHLFDAKYELDNDIRGGRMLVTEKVFLSYSDNNHGILRSIPNKYKKHTLDVKVGSVTRNGRSEPFTTSKKNNNLVLKIGSPNETITGYQSYKITYSMRNIVSFYDEHDEWYWDINGDEWSQPFEKVRAEVVMPQMSTADNLPSPKCFTGYFQSSTQACSIESIDSGYIIETTDTLLPNQTLTAAVAIPKGVFVRPTVQDWIRDNLVQLIGLLVSALGVLYLFSLWWHHGKDIKGRGVIVPQYEVPYNLSPAEVGLLADYNVDGRDLSATIIDLAVRGYLKIHDEGKSLVGVFKARNYKLILMKDDLTQLKAHEKELLTAIFDKVQVGITQQVASINKTRVSTAVTGIRTRLKDSLIKTHGFMEEKSITYQTRLIVAGVAIISMAIVFRQGWGWRIGMVILGMASIMFGILMNRRTHAGVEAIEKIMGLKLYMDVAEKDRFKKMQSVDRPYAEPSKTVELYEKLLPFAIALGVERSWSHQFEGIYSSPPVWYEGNFSSFRMTNFANNLSSSVAAMNSSFSPPSNSGSSGLSGGGFSGGGGGGGGGGGW